MMYQLELSLHLLRSLFEEVLHESFILFFQGVTLREHDMFFLFFHSEATQGASQGLFFLLQ